MQALSRRLEPRFIGVLGKSVSPRKSVAAIRRTQLIEAARRVVLRKGYHRATIQDIATEVADKDSKINLKQFAIQAKVRY